MTITTSSDPRLAKLDGFHVEIDANRERADIILDRPPFNIIVMPQRDQLRLTFEALDEDKRARVIVLRAIGEHFSSGGNIKGFMEATPEHVSKLAWNIASPARCSKPVIAANRGYCFGVGFEISLACDFRIASEACFYALPEQKLGQIPGSGGSARLQKIIGITRTKDIVMRSRKSLISLVPSYDAHLGGPGNRKPRRYCGSRGFLLMNAGRVELKRFATRLTAVTGRKSNESAQWRPETSVGQRTPRQPAKQGQPIAELRNGIARVFVAMPRNWINSETKRLDER